MDAPATAVSEPVAVPLESTPSPVQDSPAIAEALESGNTSDFKEARRRERLELKGLLKTEPAIEKREAKRAKVEKPEKNAGAKARIAQLDPEIAELNEKLRIRKLLREEEAATRPQPKAEEKLHAENKAQVATAEQGWQRYKNEPGAPKSGDFDNYEDYLDARSDFIAEHRAKEIVRSEMDSRDTRTREYQQHEQTFKSLDTQAETFAGKVLAYQKANPSAQIAPQILSVTPLRALQAMNAVLPPEQQEKPGLQHYIVQQAFDSETPGQILAHLSANDMAEMRRIWQMAEERRDTDVIAREIGRLEAKFLGSTSPEALSASPARVTQAPAPGTTLGRRAAPAGGDGQAIKTGDTRAFKEIRLRERLASKGRR